MKIAVYLIGNISPKEGGGFSYIERLIQTIDNYSFNDDIEICFVGRTPSSKISLKKKYIQLAPFFWYKTFRAFERLGVLEFFSRLFINLDFCNRSDIKVLKKNNVDIILYPKQTYREVKDFPFISMNWDIGYKSTFPFPELILNDNFEVREKWYTREIQKAFSVFVESESGKNEFLNYLNYPREKIYVVPIFPGRVVDLKVDDAQQHEILNKLKLKKESYFFYPAQFWAHKNHYNLILAFKKLIEQNPDRKLELIFTGSDHGNKDYIESVIDKHNLKNHIRILGFVSNEEIYTLYKNSIALVMPTFLGPTNMPLMEAMSIGTPVICSDLEGHREICDDSALYFNPADDNSILEKISLFLNSSNREEYLNKAALVLRHTKFEINYTIKCLEKSLNDIARVRKTFR